MKWGGGEMAVIKLARPVNPYQGLKPQYATAYPSVQFSCKNLESLSGIEII